MKAKQALPNSVKALGFVTGMVASITSGMVVTNIISGHITPTGGKIQKVAMTVGTYFISNNIAGWIGDRVETQTQAIFITVNETIDEIRRVATE